MVELMIRYLLHKKGYFPEAWENKNLRPHGLDRATFFSVKNAKPFAYSNKLKATILKLLLCICF